MANSRKPAPNSSGADRAVADVSAAVRQALAGWLASCVSSSSHIPGTIPRVAIALSGGRDSAVLLDAAARVAGEIGIHLIALHIHHGLSRQADNWQRFCAERAAGLHVPFDARRVRLDARAGQGVEAAARQARYAALRDLCQHHGATGLMTAHHADDQAETILLQLLRGTGLPGVAGMPEMDRPGRLAGVTLLRPLLHVSRAAIDAYATQHGLDWVEDASNQDSRFLRNALRHDVMPALARHVPAYRQTLARFARHAHQAQALLDELGAQDFQAARWPDGTGLDHRVLLRLGDARLTNLLRYWVRLLGLRSASESRLADWQRQLRRTDGAAQVELPHDGRVMRLYRHRLYWEEASPPPARELDTATTLRWHGQREWRLPNWRGTLIFSPMPPGSDVDTATDVPERLLGSALLRAEPRSGGERLKRHPRQPSKTLKNLFQGEGVPVWQRAVPVVWLGERILFVPRLGVDQRLLRDPSGQLEAHPGAWRRLAWHGFDE
ncbi:tRNA lysidine(34) synthetase TilS [Pandoraea sp.]|uniref:tRNA lysidine(34) synthetase TilS n=1 Tax=Pandoraea sp. TaxID=1883445 RepID=UPI00122B2471|nr:tRNA lysidine(34) synthetase TilS [Pandoraea sp.]TAL55269.1 MAG: tRNA lysidine(34) synthetase TilS [Pandoraea sp.]TAM18187.1 MAG: tRNA lysidine(34) synthetase TilS [Pandoraea sp.]